MSVAPVALEYGIYRDGDNNLDREQAACITQALRTSLRDPTVEFVVEDTTARRGFAPEGVLRTERYVVRDGQGSGLSIGPPRDPSARANLAGFVARTLDRAEVAGAKQAWVELVDHGGGDGGGLESVTHRSMMSERDIAGAIADGVARHAAAHPEDSGRKIDGVVANQCLMNTLGFADALSHAGVRYLAASPEIMLAPGVPSSVASDIAAHLDDPKAMAAGVVATTMSTAYATPDDSFSPAAAFSVLDTSPEKLDAIRTRVKQLDDDLVSALRADPSLASRVRGDERAVRGMARCERTTMPWRSDRPAIALYDKLAGDERLPRAIREDARNAAAAVQATVLAHGESRAFEPYGGIDYHDAAGPTVHAPLRASQIDPWAPEVSETANAFWKDVGGDRLARALVA